MALNEAQANGFAQQLLLAMAGSGDLKTLGPNTTSSGIEIEKQAARGERDAAYLASLYRNLVTGLQK
ncbi:hypothetical protein AB6N01_20620 [Alcaligenes nematophilus]|uniref:hypothetical protein n=1 Tax=Alcaligenes nematophilus TaxID=2994643 RepID=UPI0034E088C6